MLARRKDTRLEESSCAMTATSSEEKRCFIVLYHRQSVFAKKWMLEIPKVKFMRHIILFCRIHRLLCNLPSTSQLLILSYKARVRL
jgi:hypothetical protein